MDWKRFPSGAPDRWATPHRSFQQMVGRLTDALSNIRMHSVSYCLSGRQISGRPGRLSTQAVETPPNKHPRASGVLPKGQTGTRGGSTLDWHLSGHRCQRQQEQWCSSGIQPGLVLLLVLNRPSKECQEKTKHWITFSERQHVSPPQRGVWHLPCDWFPWRLRPPARTHWKSRWKRRIHLCNLMSFLWSTKLRETWVLKRGLCPCV